MGRRGPAPPPPLRRHRLHYAAVAFVVVVAGALVLRHLSGRPASDPTAPRTPSELLASDIAQQLWRMNEK